ncbi:MAG: 4-hydroxy-tetrahydrodipicolinate reductase [Desulfarculaceae bacterium]|nr:4-hydroxy-tetrahydrodipicolinate reductase [Desulfarculaceae bacterium]MCF8048194.1 4-hydroxy-tetrahydrodipicolinate reductase [Desulfarculaceae bacterium]MCF8065144.1 4-hydroxy-tetrahydrodipicolinate reductase [Desulfarculaceae bacterium]MCF8096804.1 4-hydroxy-tetrahydrodipicolinate reductase [Desulfarculaceae bacterium]MCF8122620.1 4-hydroxy-tetrahydrodipicolinate reductase [Desulfarculaceae bacterium]
MVKIAVAGVAGRVSGHIVRAVFNRQGAELVGAFEAPGNPTVGKSLAGVAGLSGAEGVVGDSVEEALADAQVLIDFTAPASSVKNLKICAAQGKAAVIGTTGLSEAQKKIVATQAKKVPVVFAPNMSIGMNLMFKVVAQMAEVLGPDYALEVLEAHHDQKKDAPSGTAVRLIEELCQVRGWDSEEACRHGRVGMTGARTANELGVSVIRGGDIVGDHTVYFIANGERLELTHRAHNRDTFAQGAVRAALWVVNQEPGLYDMQDVLGLREAPAHEE